MGSSAKRLRSAVAAAVVCGACGFVVLVLPLRGHTHPPAPPDFVVTIKEVMEKTITPATNTLWNVPEAPTDEEWLELEEAAVTLLVAAESNARGGAGPMDRQWTEDARWQAFDRALMAAGEQALAAIRARNVVRLQETSDPLYGPCEGCHSLFNPGVVNAAQ